MRLFKKAAVCLLAAAMAVSMLTACGGDGPSTPDNGGNGGSTGGGNTSTSTPAKPDDEDSSTTPEKPETPKEDEKQFQLLGMIPSQKSTTYRTKSQTQTFMCMVP